MDVASILSIVILIVIPIRNYPLNDNRNCSSYSQV